MIPSLKVTADKNPSYKTRSGKDTMDQVFLLSIKEANKYFRSDSVRKCELTKYALMAQKNAAVYLNEGTWWWLRSPGNDDKRAAYVLSGGNISNVGIYVNRDFYAVRPVIYIELDS